MQKPSLDLYLCTCSNPGRDGDVQCTGCLNVQGVCVCVVPSVYVRVMVGRC